jgi:hypothetical protein
MRVFQRNNKTNCTLVGVWGGVGGMHYICKQSYEDGHPNSRHMRKADEWMRRGQEAGGVTLRGGGGGQRQWLQTRDGKSESKFLISKGIERF